MKLTRLIPALFCALALVPTASAHAANPDTRIRLYKVTAEGSGTFQYDLSLPSGPDRGLVLKRSVSFAWHEQLPNVAFFSNGEATQINSGGPAQGTISGDAMEETTITGEDGKGNPVVTHGYCEAKDQSLPAGVPWIKPDPYTANPNAGGANLTVQPFETVSFPASCTANVYGGHATVGLDEIAPGQLTQRFSLPTEATRQGKIIQLVQASPQQKDRCSPTVSLGDCKLDWSGTLTFEFTGYLGGDGELEPDDLPELPAGGGAQQPEAPQGPQTPPPGSDPDDDLIVPLPSGGSLSKRGDRASVNVMCAQACSGVVRAYPAGAGAGARSAAAKPLAKARFKAPAAKPVKVKLRFRGAAARRLRRAKAVRLVVDTGSARRTIVVRARKGA